MVLLPEHPFLIVGTDLYEVKGRLYPVLVDYFSRYLEIARLPNIKTASVIGSLKNIFARQSIILITSNNDNCQLILKISAKPGILCTSPTDHTFYMQMERGKSAVQTDKCTQQ